jgi:hypothetical protein
MPSIKERLREGPPLSGYLNLIPSPVPRDPLAVILVEMNPAVSTLTASGSACEMTLTRSLMPMSARALRELAGRPTK